MYYVILSLKHMEGNRPTFWRANDAGYTNYPFHAGIYTEAQVKADPDYYNNKYDTLAVPLTEAGMEAIGFKCTVDLEKIKILTK